MSQRSQPTSKHRRDTRGRHRRDPSTDVAMREAAIARRAVFVKCLATVGAAAALSGGVSAASADTGHGVGLRSHHVRTSHPTSPPSRTTIAAPRRQFVASRGDQRPALASPDVTPQIDYDATVPDAIAPKGPVVDPSVAPQSIEAAASLNPADINPPVAAAAAPAVRTVAAPKVAAAPKAVTPAPAAPVVTPVKPPVKSGGKVAKTPVTADPTPPAVVITPPVVIVPPPPPVVVPSGGQPGPGNTGVPNGVALTVHEGDLTITTAGAVYSGLDIHGFVKVEAPNVTIKNSIIRGGASSSDIGLVNDVSNSATNFLLEDSELVPSNPSVQIDGIKGWNYTALRVDIHGTTDGAKIYGNNATIENSYIHGLVTYAHDPDHGGGQSHNDGVQVLSGSHIRIIGNTIVGGSNTALMVTQDHGTVGDMQFNNNWVSGGTCTVNLTAKPLPSLSGISLSGNRFGTHQTCTIIDTLTTTLAAAGNVFNDTSLPVKILDTGGQ